MSKVSLSGYLIAQTSKACGVYDLSKVENAEASPYIVFPQWGCNELGDVLQFGIAGRVTVL